QQVALLGRDGATLLDPAGRGAAGPGAIGPGAVGLVGAHVLDAHAERAQAGERLQHVKVRVLVAAVPAALVPADRADQPDLLVVAQRRLTQPAAPGYLLDGHRAHGPSVTYLKRLK